MTSLPLGQLFVFGFEGLKIDQDVTRLITKELAAGVILFARNIDSLEQLVELNQSIMALKSSIFAPLISIDQEGGLVARLKNICTPVPSMRSIGRLSLNNKTLPYKLGAIMAREMSALGFHLDFAPVLDVDSNPKNPVIGNRSFSNNAHEVALLGTAFIKGMQGAGLASCAKHFPGHGDTDKDSHLDLPLLEHNQQRLEEIELIPFKAAIKADVSSIMTAHILLPQIDKNFPATLSRTILQNLLRQKMKFEGIIFSDDLEMKALADRYEIKEIIRLGLLAGVDMFLICKELSKVHEALAAIHELVDSGQISKQRIEEALDRVQTFKRRYIGVPAPANLEEAKRIVRSKPHLTFAKMWENEN